MTMETLRTKCVTMQILQANKAELEEQLTEVNKNLDDLRHKEIPELMESLGLRNATFDGVGRVQTAADIWCNTKAGRKDDAMQWLRDQELDDMITEGYNASSLKALVRRLLATGAEIPDCLNVTPYTRASIIKA